MFKVSDRRASVVKNKVDKECSNESKTASTHSIPPVGSKENLGDGSKKVQPPVFTISERQKRVIKTQLKI